MSSISDLARNYGEFKSAWDGLNGGNDNSGNSSAASGANQFSIESFLDVLDESGQLDDLDIDSKALTQQLIGAALGEVLDGASAQSGGNGLETFSRAADFLGGIINGLMDDADQAATENVGYGDSAAHQQFKSDFAKEKVMEFASAVTGQDFSPQGVEDGLREVLSRGLGEENAELASLLAENLAPGISNALQSELANMSIAGFDLNDLNQLGKMADLANMDFSEMDLGAFMDSPLGQLGTSMFADELAQATGLPGAVAFGFASNLADAIANDDFSTKGFTETISDIGIDTIADFASSPFSAADSLGNGMSSLGDSIGGPIGDGLSALGGAISGFADAVTGAIDGIADAVDGAIGNNADGNGEQASASSDSDDSSGASDSSDSGADTSSDSDSTGGSGGGGADSGASADSGGGGGGGGGADSGGGGGADSGGGGGADSGGGGGADSGGGGGGADSGGGGGGADSGGGGGGADSGGGGGGADSGGGGGGGADSGGGGGGETGDGGSSF